MKFGKKLLGLVVAASLVVGTSVTAFAATNNDVISALTAAGADSRTITAATNFLNTHTVSAANLDTAVAKINDVKNNYHVSTIEQYNALNATQKAAVAADIKSAAAALGMTVTKTADGGALFTYEGSTVYDTTGTANGSGSTGAAGNTTATNYGNVAALGALLAIAGVAGTTVAVRKNALGNN